MSTSKIIETYIDERLSFKENLSILSDLIDDNKNLNESSFSCNLSIEQVKKIAPNSFNEEGKLKEIKIQLEEMNNNPSSFGYSTVEVGESLNFVKINCEYLFMSNKGLNHSLKHLCIDEISIVLSRIKNDVVLGLDYLDKRGPMKKTIVIDNHKDIYILSLRKNSVRGIQIDTIDNLFNKNNDFLNYYNMALEQGRKIYVNEKSADFMERFTLTRSGVSNTNAFYNSSIEQNVEKVNSHSYYFDLSNSLIYEPRKGIFLKNDIPVKEFNIETFICLYLFN